MKRILLTLIVFASLAACGRDAHQDLKQWMQDATKDLRGRVPPLPEIKPFPVISYEAGDKADPFRPKNIETEKKSNGGGVKPNFERRKEPLEAYPLESLKMIGLVQKGNVKHAIIRAGTAVYQVKIGNYIGQNFGVVTAISDNEVMLKELVQDPTGDWVERTSKLQLQEQETKK